MFFDSHWGRIRTLATPTNVRLALVLVALVVMALGGSADDQWCTC